MVPSTPVGGATISASQKLATGRLLIVGVFARETTLAAACNFQLFDGEGSGGQLVNSISLAAGESEQFTFGDLPLLCQNGLYLNMLAGTADIVCAVTTELLVGPGVFEAIMHGEYAGVAGVR